MADSQTDFRKTKYQLQFKKSYFGGAANNGFDRNGKPCLPKITPKQIQKYKDHLDDIDKEINNYYK